MALCENECENFSTQEMVFYDLGVPAVLLQLCWGSLP